jgi:hypothetical protein
MLFEACDRFIPRHYICLLLNLSDCGGGGTGPVPNKYKQHSILGAFWGPLAWTSHTAQLKGRGIPRGKDDSKVFRWCEDSWWDLNNIRRCAARCIWVHHCRYISWFLARSDVDILSLQSKNNLQNFIPLGWWPSVYRLHPIRLARQSALESSLYRWIKTHCFHYPLQKLRELFLISRSFPWLLFSALKVSNVTCPVFQLAVLWDSFTLQRLAKSSRVT